MDGKTMKLVEDNEIFDIDGSCSGLIGWVRCQETSSFSCCLLQSVYIYTKLGFPVSPYLCLNLQKPLIASKFDDLVFFSLALEQAIHIKLSQSVSSYKESLITCLCILNNHYRLFRCERSVPSHSILFMLELTLPQGTREGKHGSLLGCLQISCFEEDRKGKFTQWNALLEAIPCESKSIFH